MTVKETPKHQIAKQYTNQTSKTKNGIQSTQITHKSNQPTRTTKYTKPTKQTTTQYVKRTKPSSSHVVPNNLHKPSTTKHVGKSYSKQTTQPKQRKTVKLTTIHHKVSPTKVKPQKTTKAIKPANKKPHWLSTATKTKKAPSTSKVTKTTPKRTSSTVTKKKSTKPSVKTSIKTTTKSKAKPTSTVKVKSTYSQPKKNYYNKPPKRWPSNVPGGDNVRDFGQTTKESGIDDALKIMKKSGNKGVTIEHTKAKDANIATVFNWNPTAKQLTYGTGTAIGRHTILTANHVVNDQRAHKPLTPAQPENMRINLLQEGSKVVRSLQVFGVQMLQYGDVALVYTYEDISKYMKIRKIASESTIKSMKANTPIHMYHYGTPYGKYKNDPAGTMYHSKGKYSMTARNVNPIGYYQMMAEPGSSGGAVLNSKNEIIGVHAFRVDAGDYKKYHLNTMAEIRGKLRKEIIDNIV
ncbi:trypsin-like peptidase domain-containing protein [Staphylococcus capitis]|uniref:trypsin-like peptidase domain-containing protein n=1 Tax=Staphylococcus capitis TaxID=29388 RepID=UPI0039846300